MVKAEGIESEMKGNIPDYKTFHAKRKMKKNSMKGKAKISPLIVLEASITSSAHYMALGPRRRQKSLKASTDVLSDVEDNQGEVEFIPSPVKGRGRVSREVIPILPSKVSNPALLLKLPNARSRFPISAVTNILESTQVPLVGNVGRQRRGLELDIRDLPAAPLGRKRNRDRMDRLIDEEAAVLDIKHAGTPKKSRKEKELEKVKESGKKGKSDAVGVSLIDKKIIERNDRRAVDVSELLDSSIVDLTASKLKSKPIGRPAKELKSNKWAIPAPTLTARGLTRRGLPSASSSSSSSCSSSSSSSFIPLASYDKVLRDDSLTSAIYQNFSKAGMEGHTSSEKGTTHSSEGFSAIFSLAGLDCFDNSNADGLTGRQTGSLSMHCTAIALIFYFLLHILSLHLHIMVYFNLVTVFCTAPTLYRIVLQRLSIIILMIADITLNAIRRTKRLDGTRRRHIA